MSNPDSYHSTWFPVILPLEELEVERAIDEHPDLLHLMGRLLSRWAELERTLCFLLASILDGRLKAAFAILYALNSVSSKVDVCQSSLQLEVPSGPEKDGLLLLLARVRKLAKTRNKYVHGFPLVLESPTIENFRPLTNSPLRRDPFTANDLKRHIHLVEEVSVRLDLACEPNPKRWIAKGFPQASTALFPRILLQPHAKDTSEADNLPQPQSSRT